VGSCSSLLLVIAAADDPVVSRFVAWLNAADPAIWWPKSIEELGCSVDIEGRDRLLSLHDDAGWGPIDPARLAGIWYREMPSIPIDEALQKRDLDYARVEFRSFMRLIWDVADCPAIGFAPDETAAGMVDAGLESRIVLRRLGLPVVPDLLGTRQDVDGALMREIGDREARITHHDGVTSYWARGSSDAADSDGRSRHDPVAATVTDSTTVRVAIQVSSDMLVVEIDHDGRQTVMPPAADLGEVRRVASRVHEAIGAPLTCSFFCRYEHAWRLTRVSLQVPDWLSDTVEQWLFPRLLALFRPAGRHATSVVS
jgi:hypothetical protein